MTSVPCQGTGRGSASASIPNWLSCTCPRPYETNAAAKPRHTGRWFENLDTTPAAKVVAVVTRMEAGNFGDHRGVGGGILECRIHSGPGYRIYVAIDKDTVIILLGGGTKRKQQSDIANAQDRWKDYINRKTQGGHYAAHP